jgi:hypothetical protein
LFGLGFSRESSSQPLKYASSDDDAENDYHHTSDLMEGMNFVPPEDSRTGHEKAVDRSVTLPATTRKEG